MPDATKDAVKAFDATPVNYTQIAKQIELLQPRALTPDQYEDVVKLIEWMQQEVTKQHHLVIKQAEALKLRELELVKRERDVAIRTRTVHAAAGIATPRRSYFWR